MAGDGVGQLPAQHVVVDLAAVGRTGINTVEVAQITGQHAAAQRKIVLDTRKILTVEIFQLAVEVTQANGFPQLVLGPCVAEVA
ncbi:hypothetical protein D3C76_1739890 [compost metagenome]